jgi:uncharacterized protein
MSVSDDTSAQTTQPIWDGLFGSDEHGPYLIGGRCTKCAFVTLGVRDLCPTCWSHNAMVPVPIGRTGRLYTCTIIHQVPEGYAAPFAVGYIDLDEGVRVFAHLAHDERSLRIDEPVRLTLAPLKKATSGWLLGPRYVASES